MSVVEPLVVVGLILTGGLAFVGALERWFETYDATGRQRRAMRRLPLAKLNAVQPGKAVRIQGRITTSSVLLQSPLERRECCAYRLMVWDARGDEPSLQVDETNFCELDVEADGVAASIQSPSITLEGTGDTHYSGGGDRPTGRQALIIERYGLEPTTLIYTEYVLCPGDMVTVVARVSSVDDAALDDARFVCRGSGGYRSTPRRRVLVADKFPLTVVAPGGRL